MLDGYWLLADGGAAVSSDPARKDEFIALFKHACLFQRQINLSDLMVVVSPNFRNAIRTDSDFRRLAMSDIVRLAYTHKERDRHGPVMDLVGVKDFHVTNRLADQLFYDYYANAGSDAYLRELDGKPTQTRLKFDSSLRDPWFTKTVLDRVGCAYLRRNLGGYANLFEDITRRYYEANISGTDIALGVIHFVEGRPGWAGTSIVDEFVAQLGTKVSAQELDLYKIAIWHFAKALLIRAEADLLAVDPVLPPDEQFYIDVLHDTTGDNISLGETPVELRSYVLSTDLDDHLIYRNLDFATICAIRDSDEGLEFFAACEAPPSPPGSSADASRRHQEMAARKFAVSMEAYKRRVERELSLRFAPLRRVSLQRNVKLQIATSLSHLTTDATGKPKPVIRTLVETVIIGAAAHISPDVAAAARYLTVILGSHLGKADELMSNFTEETVQKLTMEALKNQTSGSPIKSYLISPSDISSAESFTYYRGHKPNSI
jgi:hypothetical protein